MSLSFTQQIVFVYLRFVINSTWMTCAVWKPLLIVTKCTSRIFCVTFRFERSEHVSSLCLLCGDIGHCFLFLLMAVVLFTIREKQDGTFSVAADSPQIRVPHQSVRLPGLTLTSHELLIVWLIMQAIICDCLHHRTSIKDSLISCN